MKTLAILLLAATPALAGPGVRVQTDAGPIRAGVSCSLELFGQDLTGTCAIARRGGTTIIKAGKAIYYIERDDKTLGRFFQDNPEGKDRFMGVVQARGDCWVGDGVKFCAQ